MDTTTNNESRFDWLETDDSNKTAKEVKTAKPLPAPAPVDPSIDQEGAKRAVAAGKLADKVGLVFGGKTLFAWGTKGQWGTAAQNAREELSAQPLLTKLADDAAKVVEAEARRGDIVPVRHFIYGPGDLIRRVNRAAGTGIPVAEQALKQLVARIDAPGGAYLADKRLTGDLRAAHVNHWLKLRNDAELEAKREHDAREEAKVLAKPDHTPKPYEPARLKLLSKMNTEGKRVAYGVVGPKYPHTYGMDAVIRDVLGSFPGETRGVLVYDASTTKWRVDAAIGAEFEPCVGDIFRLGVKFGAHDAGGGSYWASLYGIRVRCVNFTKIHAGKKLGRVRHIGTIDDLRKRVVDLVALGSEALNEFSALYREANEEAIISREWDREGGDSASVFKALIQSGYVSAPDGEDVAVERFVNAWEKERGETRAHFVNAITRAAHESPWSNPWATDTLEEQASQLLYNHAVLTPAQMDAVVPAFEM